jgi:hypothetical protein
MGVYGSSEYSLDVYGTGDSQAYLTWHFLVFWDDAFVDEATQSQMIDLQTNRGRDHLLATGGSGWQRYRPGEATATFYNDDGRFDPYNSSGPLYGFLLPGRVVRITVDYLAPYDDTEVNYPILRGVIDDIQTFYDGQRKARIVVKDGLEWLNRRSIALGLAEDAQALVTGAAIATQVNFDDVDDWAIEQLGASSVVIPYAFGNEASALALINQLVDAEAGQVFQAADGTLTFVTNDYTQASTTDIDGSELLKDFELKTPWEVVRTRASLTANPMAEGTPAVLWQYGNTGVVATWTAAFVGDHPTTPYLSKFDVTGLTPPATLTVDAIFSTGGPSTSPTVDYDFLIADTDNPLNNWIDAVTDHPTFIDLTNFEDIGVGLRLNFVWDGGAGFEEIVIPWAEVTATPIEALDPVTVTAEDSAAIATYGEKTFSLDNPFIQDQGYAQAYADWVVNQLKAAKLFPTLQIENRFPLQFGPDLYIDKIHLTVDALGIDDTFRVGAIRHKWKLANGMAVVTIFSLEPVLEALE